jgi:hypothetical protein
MSSQELAPTPRLEPGAYTAKQVLEWVATIVKEEPKRLHMLNWFTFVRGVQWAYTLPAEEIFIPACGTVACLAGWINLAITGMETMPAEGEAGAIALNRLGLFPGSPARNDLYRVFLRDGDDAGEAIANLEGYIERHRTVLESTIVQAV